MENDNKFLKGLLSGLGIAAVGICLFFALNFIMPSTNSKIKTDVTEVAEETTIEDGKETVSVTSDAVLEKMNEIIQKIDSYYLNEVDEQALIDGLFAGLISGLGDPYSVYFTEEKLAAMHESTSGEYSGIGATMSKNEETDAVNIVNVFEGSPAAMAGILPGDIIYKVEDEEVTGWDISSIVAKVKGKAGTTVNLTIVREGESDYITLEVERRTIEVPIISHQMLDHNIGYINIIEFNEVSYPQFREALADLEGQGMERLIVDVRNNPGGLLSTVSDILDLLLPEGLIVYTEDRDGNREEITSDDEHQFTKPLVVLVNGYSASASEVFAGAIQDYGIGTIVGTTTFGKGIVQRLMYLSDGTALKLTISKYFTPNGNNIHGIGIVPDVEVDLSDEVKKLVTITQEADNQLQTAIEVLLGIGTE